MHRLIFRIQNSAPLVISARSGDANMVATYPYIPGTSILGMLVARYKRKAPVKETVAASNELFHRIFLNGAVTFGNAYPVISDADDEVYLYTPTPVSIHREKRGAEIYDLLCMNTTPDEQTKNLGGFCHIEDNEISTSEVETSVNFHHARDRNTGTPSEGKIFNYESITQGHTFQGELRGRKKDLQELLVVFGNKWSGHIGRSKNNQYGKVDIKILDETPIKITTEQRFKSEISLTLISDTIIYNEYGYATTDPDNFQKYLGVKVEKIFVRQTDTETYVGIWRLKKPSEVCFSAGSCFLLKDIDEESFQKICELQQTGLGERTHEGYGCFVLGRQEHEVLDKHQPDLPRIKKPAFPMPETTKKILKQLILESVQEEVSLTAIRDSATFNVGKRLTNSLIGRLRGMSGSMDQSSFADSIEELRKPAKEQLKALRNNSTTLFDFINNLSITAKEVLKKAQYEEVNKLSEEIEFQPDAVPGYQKSLFQNYMTTFFSTMRKNNIQEEKNG